MKIIYYIIIIIICIFYLSFYSFFESFKYINKKLFIQNYTENLHFLSTTQCNDFKNLIQKNKYIQKNPLNEYFNNSKGMMIEFNRQNAYHIFQSKNIDFLYTYFNQIQKSYATHFILNILIIPPNQNKSNAIDYHYDTTISLKPTNFFIDMDYVPECVSVLYIDLPKQFSGGKLKLYNTIFNVGNIHPEIGKLVEFNGILLHGVENIIDLTHTNHHRISIVLEQYSID